MWKWRVIWIPVLAAIVAVAFLGCKLPQGIQTVPKSQDMDTVVRSKGVPLAITETSFGGERPGRYVVNLLYHDGTYTFGTDKMKTHTVYLESSTSFRPHQRQEPLPGWFKKKYPDLRWRGIDVR